MDTYDFNAPVYLNFENLHKEEESQDLEPIRNIDLSKETHTEDKVVMPNSTENPAKLIVKSDTLEDFTEGKMAIKSDSPDNPTEEMVVKLDSLENSAEGKLMSDSLESQSNETETLSRSDLHAEESIAMVETNLFPKKVEKIPMTKSGKTPQRNLNNPVRQSPRLAAIAKSIRRANASRGLLTSSNKSSGLKCHRRSLSEGSNIVSSFSKVKKPTVQRKIAIVRPEQHMQNSSLADEDLNNLNQTAKYTKALHSNRQRAKNANTVKGPLKSGPLKPTKPVGFNFATDSRLGKKQETSTSETVDFQRTLRSSSVSSSCENLRKATKVQPFNLHNPSKPKQEAKPFLSLAELSLKFHTKTPDRFRAKRNNNEPFLENTKKTRNNSGGITQPQTPQLTTKLRSRPVNIPTREEIEAKEIEEAQKHQFKAKPLNKDILKGPDIKSMEVTKIATVPEPFNITDTRKAEMKLNLNLADSCQELMESSCSLSSIPHGGVSTQWNKKLTEIKPFSFESRDLEMIRKKKEKIQKMLEEEKKAAEFHAHPMPIHDVVKGLPPKKVLTPTKLKPFKLMSDLRGSARQITLQKELEALEEMEKNQRKFEAQPDTVLHKKPFVPLKSKKPLTDISGFSLNTDKRAEERQSFDAHLKEKEDQLRAEKEAFGERKRLEEEEQVKEMRKNAVHKAQPIRHFKPVEIKQGLLPTTLPMTPNFATDERLRSRSLSKQNLNGTAPPQETTNVDGTFTME